MKSRKLLLIGMVITTLLLAASISYDIFGKRDRYQYFSGLGSNIAVSPDDQRMAFSFYEEGTETIYTSNLEGNNVKKITNPDEDRHRKPSFSYDGRKILYLSQNPEGVQSLHSINLDDSNAQRLSDESQHVSEAIFSNDGKSVFFIATPAVDIHKTEGESQEGPDLYSVNSDGTNMKKLTDDDHFSMESLVLSSDGKELYYKDYTDLYTFNLEKGTESLAALTKNIPKDPFHLTFSPDGNSIAYTAVSKESMNSSLYEYELFLRDLVSSKSKQLTKLKTAIVSPVFLNKENKIIFLEHTNWSGIPEEYKIMTVDLETEELKEIHLDLTKEDSGNLVMKTIDNAVNGWSIAILYTLLLFMGTLLCRTGKIYLPSLISLCLALLGISASFVVAATIDPWMGIGIGTLAAGIMGCTIISFLFAFGMKFYRKRK